MSESALRSLYCVENTCSNKTNSTYSALSRDDAVFQTRLLALHCNQLKPKAVLNNSSDHQRFYILLDEYKLYITYTNVVLYFSTSESLSNISTTAVAFFKQILNTLWYLYKSKKIHTMETRILISQSKLLHYHSRTGGVTIVVAKCCSVNKQNIPFSR